MSIRAADLGRALRLVDDHVRTPGPDAFSREMLIELGRLIPADHVEFFELREHDGAGLAYLTSDDQAEPPAHLEEIFGRYGRLNPLGAFKWRPRDGVKRLSSLTSPRSLRNLPLYEAYWGFHHIRDQLKVWLERTPDSAVCLTLDRSDDTFSDRDMALLQVLQPLLRIAIARREAADSGHAGALTLREAQVLGVAAFGLTNAEIGAQLGMSAGTVRKHLERAYGKLGVQNRGEAVALLRRSAQRDASG